MPYIDTNKLNEAMYHEAFEKTSDLQKWDSGCWIRYKLYENVLKSISPADVVEKELYNRLLEDAVIMKEALDKYQKADEVEAPRWIPVSERLPEYETDVLVTVEGWYKGKMIDRATDLATYWQHESYIDNFETVNDWIEYGEWKVTAWMPLPEPYRKDVENGSRL